MAHAVTIFLSTYILIRIYSTKTKWNHRAIFSIMFIGEKVSFDILEATCSALVPGFVVARRKSHSF